MAAEQRNFHAPPVFIGCVTASQNRRCRDGRSRCARRGRITTTDVTRRGLLAGSAAAAAALPAFAARPASAAAPATGKQATGLYRYKVGGYELTALHDGTWYRPIDDKFVK